MIKAWSGKNEFIPDAIAKKAHIGVRGTVNTNDYRRDVVWNAPGAFIEIRAGRLDAEAWDYGYYVRLEDGAVKPYEATMAEKYPGDYNTWFESEFDATLFVLHMMRSSFKESSEIRDEINRRISKMLSPTLF